MAITYIVGVQPCLLPRSLGPSAGLQIRPDPFPGSLRVLGELSGAGVNDGLDLLFGLFGNRDVAVQVLIHKQSDKHLEISSSISLLGPLPLL